MNKVESALSRTTDTKASGDRNRYPSAGRGYVQRNSFPDRRALVVADANTWRAAGGDVHRILARSGCRAGRAACLHRPEALCRVGVCRGAGYRCCAATDAVPVAVGSGVINDLTKLCSQPQRAPLHGRGYGGVDGRLYGLRGLDHQGRQQADLRLPGAAGDGARPERSPRPRLRSCRRRAMPT